MDFFTYSPVFIVLRFLPVFVPQLQASRGVACLTVRLWLYLGPPPMSYPHLQYLGLCLLTPHS